MLLSLGRKESVPLNRENSTLVVGEPPEDGPRSIHGVRVKGARMQGEKETERQLSRFQNRQVARARHSLGGHPCDLSEVHR